MSTQQIVFLCVGPSLIGLGYLFKTKPSFVEWALSFGSGEKLVERWGKEAATKVTRTIFGPLLMVLGALILLMGLAS
ncbi:MAG: hypothetical protein JSU09_00325 [Bacteroidetes bacterium]|nr:hypothetical protein [Bacteroidota bacterium]